MSYSFVNRPRVYDDIIEALDYFVSINSDLAERFLDDIEDAKQKILNAPEGFQIKHAGIIRTVLLQTFEYHVYYILENDKIVILAILHARSGQEKIENVKY